MLGAHEDIGLDRLIIDQCRFTANEMKVFIGRDMVVDIIQTDNFRELKNN